MQTPRGVAVQSGDGNGALWAMGFTVKLVPTIKAHWDYGSGSNLPPSFLSQACSIQNNLQSLFSRYGLPL